MITNELTGIETAHADQSTRPRQKRIRLGVLTYGLDRPLSGISRYAFELALALEQYQDRLELSLLTPFRGSPAGLDRLYPSRRIYGHLLPLHMLGGPLQIASVANGMGLQIVHDPMGISPFLIPRRFGTYRRIVTIHDMIPFVHPETHARLTNTLFRHYIPRTLRFVDHVVVPSKSSKDDVLRFWGLPDEKVTVILSGVSARFSPASPDAVRTVIAQYELPRQYILTVGALQSRKNLETLFDAYQTLRQRGLPHKLVVVGRKAWKTTGIFRRLRELGLEQEVVLTGYVDDHDLPALYSGASAFAFPSLYEGFGLPPLEAMACGTPVVASNTSSLPEVVAGGGITLPPRDVQGLADAIEMLVSDSALWHEYRERGLARAKQLTWERTARQHMDLYERFSGIR